MITKGSLFFIGISLLLVLGLLIPAIVAEYSNLTIEQIPEDSILNGVINILNADLSILGLQLNPFKWIDAINDYLIKSIIALSVFPELILIPLTIFIILILIYSLLPTI